MRVTVIKVPTPVYVLWSWVGHRIRDWILPGVCLGYTPPHLAAWVLRVQTSLSKSQNKQ